MRGIETIAEVALMFVIAPYAIARHDNGIAGTAATMFLGAPFIGLGVLLCAG